MQTTQKYEIQLPKYSTISKDSVEVVLIAKQFTQADIEKAKKSNGDITLIRYFWFEDELFLVDYLNNDPDDLIEANNTEKIKKIKDIIDNKNVSITEIDMFFYKLEKAKTYYSYFIQKLKSFSKVTEQVNKSTIRVFAENELTFSIIGFTGKGQKRCILRIDTNIENIKTLNLKFDDRMKINGKLKGSIGAERFQVYINKQEELDKLIDLIKGKVHISNH